MGAAGAHCRQAWGRGGRGWPTARQGRPSCRLGATATSARPPDSEFFWGGAVRTHQTPGRGRSLGDHFLWGSILGAKYFFGASRRKIGETPISGRVPTGPQPSSHGLDCLHAAAINAHPQQSESRSKKRCSGGAGLGGIDRTLSRRCVKLWELCSQNSIANPIGIRTNQQMTMNAALNSTQKKVCKLI